jgi:RNA polymerase sigma factor (sigma-70 family)
MTDFLAEQNSLMESIMGQYGGLIRGAVSRAAGGQPGADDIVSEVYFAVLLTVRKFGTGWRPPKSFIFAVVRNKVNDFLRQKYREKERIEEIHKHLKTQTSQKEDVLTRIHCLTASEFRVFRLLGLGMTNSEMAESLHISLYTIRSHMKKIHAKCGVSDRAKLTLIAHLTCYREQPETLEEENTSAEPAAAGGRSSGSMTEDRHPELWEAAPSPHPMAIDRSTDYIS